ncbi:MAG: DUF359 domain-containing protein [Promethearchaeota archaeon]|nr:MAG: DUF359 domain-containing protein [Candidatus Lokiarchaeota archaeon]
MWMEYNLRIPQDKRYEFAQPLDKLISGKREETLLKVENIIKNYIKSNLSINFYIVGDIVSKDFLANQFLKSFIKLCIIDEKTQRKKIYIKTENFEEIIELENPEGTIQKESWSLLKTIVESKKKTLLIITKGEEDLLVLPLILKLPLEENVKNFVFYGQPPITDARTIIPEGIVLVDVNIEIQNKVKKYINLMEKF